MSSTKHESYLLPCGHPGPYFQDARGMLVVCRVDGRQYHVERTVTHVYHYEVTKDVNPPEAEKEQEQ